MPSSSMETVKTFDTAHAAAWKALQVNDLAEARYQLEVMRKNVFQDRASAHQAIEQIESLIKISEDEGGSDAN